MNQKLSLYHEARPWGHFVNINEEPGKKEKIITVKPGQSLSYQRHKHREETWLIVSGSGVFVLDEEEKPVYELDEVFIPKMAKHRIKAGEKGVVIYEIQKGEYLEEDDIERFSDDYGRV
ncbi:hypothetical protein C0585_07655 [Candidatus Woesearchaeota archaeon]|nr:MAG: hypothetical protein C0585_07655 [Candidatus Woesearchaeota archaeon]